ncbi:MAG: YbaB/EbfC family nucleoid-associated protein, partial [Opitutus sp.]
MPAAFSRFFLARGASRDETLSRASRLHEARWFETSFFLSDPVFFCASCAFLRPKDWWPGFGCGCASLWLKVWRLELIRGSALHSAFGFTLSFHLQPSILTSTMAGLGKLVKQAQKMQKGIEALQVQLEAKEIEVSSGGGAVKIKISGTGKFLALQLDPEFLKEDAKLVSDTILAAIQDAAKQSKDYNEAEMQKVTGAFNMPGLM